MKPVQQRSDHLNPTTTPGFVRRVEVLHTKRVTALAFSPRGRVIASASQDTSVRLGNTETGNQLAIQPTVKPAWAFVAVAIAPDGYTVASVSQGSQRDNSTHMNSHLWYPIPDSLTQPGRHVRGLYPFGSPTFSPTERLIAFACDRVRLFNVDTGNLHSQFPEDSNYPSCVCFTPDGQGLVTGHDDGSISIWNVAGDLLSTHPGQGQCITTLALSPNGTLIATAGDNGEIRLWDFSDGTELNCFSGQWTSTPFLAFLPDSLRLVSFHDPEMPGTVRQWHVQNGSMGDGWSHGGSQLTCIAVSPDGVLVGTGTAQGRVTLWDRAVILNDPDPTPPESPQTGQPPPSAVQDDEDYFEGI